MKKIRQALGVKDYFIGFSFEKSIGTIEFNTIKWLDTSDYSGGWFADPFILSYDGDNIELLVEEYRYCDRKGRISKLNIKCTDGEFVLQKVKCILELSTHLSFPFIYREDGKVYICPENNESGRLTIYEYDSQKETLTSPHIILNEKVVDTVITKIGGIYYALATRVTNDPYDDARYLDIYSSDSLTGIYSKVQVIQNEKREERGAGAVMVIENKMLRPAQCCQNRYGESLVIYELTHRNAKFVENVYRRIFPDSKSKNGKGMHTLNYFNGLFVVDGLDYHHKMIGRIARMINKLR